MDNIETFFFFFYLQGTINKMVNEYVVNTHTYILS